MNGADAHEVTARPAGRLGAVRRFVATEHAGAVLMLVATLAALGWANSPWGRSYEAVWSTHLGIHLGSGELTLQLREWVNQGLMALFFLVAGLEIRREFDMGELRERRRVATPVLAALGGMVVPVLLYLALNAGRPTAVGWGIVMGTDTAFALGVLALTRGASARVRTFLLTVVVVDDAVALTVVALAYSQDLSWPALLAAVALYGLVLALRALKVRAGWPYLFLGTGVWAMTLAAGVHPTVAGVALGLVATAYPPRREGLRRAGTRWRTFRMNPTPALARRTSRSVTDSLSPNERYQHLFHPWTSYLIVPLFALANAGVTLDAQTLSGALTSPITIGIVLGLVVGKTVGILGTTWAASRIGGLPLPLPWAQLIGASALGGIGFTVSLLIADTSFTGPALSQAKVGVLAASVLAAVLSWTTFAAVARLPARLRTAGADRLAPPLTDLADPVDPDVDHVLGYPDAPVTLVWYGDAQCPHCRAAHAVVRQLRRVFGEDLAVVYRHLPLHEIHPHAQLAAEATEAAAAQGQFWPMLTTIYAHQQALTAADLTTYAAALGLDVETFTADLEDRRHALRVERDADSADTSGATGTPTFYVNDRRYTGRHDVPAMAAEIRRTLQIQRLRRKATTTVGSTPAATLH